MSDADTLKFMIGVMTGLVVGALLMVEWPDGIQWFFIYWISAMAVMAVGLYSASKAEKFTEWTNKED